MYNFISTSNQSGYSLSNFCNLFEINNRRCKSWNVKNDEYQSIRNWCENNCNSITQKRVGNLRNCATVFKFDGYEVAMSGKDDVHNGYFCLYFIINRK